MILKLTEEILMLLLAFRCLIKVKLKMVIINRISVYFVIMLIPKKSE